ncbi:hypothetical protein [Pseudotabrizicola formosa]|uniref:ribonuclease toxin HepT-like protein n=1 Tax=Pseudotabrizicola formosa TaxID=2030009 RepID=UPI000CD0EC0D|nr:hypothetical protein [Pseudotabrizicola formosa]
MDARWILIKQDFASAAYHLKLACELYASPEFAAASTSDDIQTKAYLMAFLHAMQSGYTSLENGLLRLLIVFDEARPTGGFWQKDLLSRVKIQVGCRPPIFDETSHKHADELRRFRNLVMTGYSHLDLKHAVAAVTSASYMSQNLDELLFKFINFVDQEPSK